MTRTKKVFAGAVVAMLLCAGAAQADVGYGQLRSEIMSLLFKIGLIDSSGAPIGGGGGENLAATLALGNTTGATGIEISDTTAEIAGSSGATPVYVTVRGGAGTGTATGGGAYLYGGSGGATDGDGGGAQVRGGNAQGTGVGGLVLVSGGTGSGQVTVSGGASSGANPGGLVSVVGGQGSASGSAGGNVLIQGGGPIAAPGAGGDVTVSGGNSSSSGVGGSLFLNSGSNIGSGNSGNVSVDAGPVTTGTAGWVIIGSGNATAVKLGRSGVTTTFTGTTNTTILDGTITTTNITASGTSLQLTSPAGANLHLGASGFPGLWKIETTGNFVPSASTRDLGRDALRVQDVYTSGVLLGIATKTAAYTVAVGDHTILADATAAAFTVTLPAAASHTGRVVVVKKTDSSANAITIDASAAETIDGALTQSLSVQYESITVQCDGTTWWIQ